MIDVPFLSEIVSVRVQFGVPTFAANVPNLGVPVMVQSPSISTSS